MADPSDLQAEIDGIDAKISRLGSKEERLEEALEGNGVYLGTTDHVRSMHQFVAAVSTDDHVCYRIARIYLRARCRPMFVSAFSLQAVSLLPLSISAYRGMR